MDRADDLVEIARDISLTAHLGQIDKVGEAYWTHPYRVAQSLYRYNNVVIATAYLHDVLEDTSMDGYTLLQLGIPREVVMAVSTLTHRKGVSMEDYYAEIRKSPIAVVVKRADIRDNLLPHRVEQLDPETRERLAKKYARGLELLLDQAS